MYSYATHQSSVASKKSSILSWYTFTYFALRNSFSIWNNGSVLFLHPKHLLTSSASRLHSLSPAARQTVVYASQLANKHWIFSYLYLILFNYASVCAFPDAAKDLHLLNLVSRMKGKKMWDLDRGYWWMTYLFCLLSLWH